MTSRRRPLSVAVVPKGTVTAVPATVGSDLHAGDAITAQLLGILGTLSNVLGLLVIPAWILVRIVLLLVEFGYFLLLYKLLTPSKTLRWRDCLPGALLMTAGFAVLKIIGGAIMDHTIAHWSSLYGTIGVVFALIAWLWVLGRLVVLVTIVETLDRSRLEPDDLPAAS